MLRSRKTGYQTYETTHNGRTFEISRTGPYDEPWHIRDEDGCLLGQERTKRECLEVIAQYTGA
jgi:hypothetical protein